MEIDHQDICKQVEQTAQQLRLAENESLPVPLLVEIHGQQDYSIAYFCNLIDTPLSWDLQVCTFFVDKNSNIYEHNFEQILPSMRNSEMMTGAPKHMIKRKGGMKSQWKGLLKEVDQSYDEDRNITKDHKAIKTIIYISTEACFINAAAYDHFHELLRHRDSGNLIKKLEAMERDLYKQKHIVEAV